VVMQEPPVLFQHSVQFEIAHPVHALQPHDG
jgi:hypothetical protein